MHKAVRPVRFTGPTADWFNIPLLRWLGGMDVELDTLRALAVAAGSPTDAVVVFLRPNDRLRLTCTVNSRPSGKQVGTPNK